MLTRSKEEQKRKKSVQVETKAFWKDLCEVHGLKRSEKKELRRMAKDLGYSDPCLLFFVPDTFSKYLKDNRGRIGSGKRERLSRIAKILFEEENPKLSERNGAVGDDGLPHRFAPDELNDINLSSKWFNKKATDELTGSA